MIPRLFPEKSRRAAALSLGLVAAAVLLFYGWTTAISVGEWGKDGSAYNYNLLVRGFRSGHLTLAKAVPPQLARLKDPFDPDANLVYRLAPYGLHDMSYFEGKLYLYFGVTPVFLLFWPWFALTGHYLVHKYAVAIFCSAGFLATAGLVRALGRRYFPEVGWGARAACVLALGLATGVPILLQRADVCEVPISCAYALQMLTLVALWQALHRPARAGRWLALGSLAYGLAVGSRPSVLFGAVVLLFPVVAALRRTPPEPGVPPGGPGRALRLLLAAALPLLACGLALALYNYLRFHNPLEFGEHYQLAGDRQDTVQHFSLRYLWFDFRVYFLAPVHLSRAFPFVRDITSPPLPAGHHVIEDPFGVLPGIPFVLLALAAPLALRGRVAAERLVLGSWVAAVALLFGNTALVMDLFYGSCSRYEIEFLPLLVLLAVIGVYGLDRALAGRPGWRRAARGGWGALLVWSIAFNLLGAAEHYVVEHYNLANWFMDLNRVPEAIEEFRHVVSLRPDYAEAYDNLGSALLQTGHTEEARASFESALRYHPDSAEAHNNLGNALIRLGHPDEAIAQYRQALRIKPNSAALHYNLASLLLDLQRGTEAEPEYREAVRLNPAYTPQMYLDLGNALVKARRFSEALVAYREVVRLSPANAEAHYNLGGVLRMLGQPVEAQEQYQEALRLNPALRAGGR
jgi:tetratricopeptide (TPR) repeat protein